MIREFIKTQFHTTLFFVVVVVVVVAVVAVVVVAVVAVVVVVVVAVLVKSRTQLVCVPQCVQLRTAVKSSGSNSRPLRIGEKMTMSLGMKLHMIMAFT